METELTTIPMLRRVFYDVFADLPVAGIRVEDLAYATDREVFYRWSGAAWEPVTIHSSSGIAANIPAAADLPNGSLYYETDTTILRQVQAGAWQQIVFPPTNFTELAGGEDYQISASDIWEDWDISAIIPAGAVAVLISYFDDWSTVQGHSMVGARANGSALARWWRCVPGLIGESAKLTECDANRVVELFCTGANEHTHTWWNVLGYWS